MAVEDTSQRFRYPFRDSSPTKDDWNRLIRDLLDLQRQVNELTKRVEALE